MWEITNLFLCLLWKWKLYKISLKYPFNFLPVICFLGSLNIFQLNLGFHTDETLKLQKNSICSSMFEGSLELQLYLSEVVLSFCTWQANIGFYGGTEERSPAIPRLWKGCRVIINWYLRIFLIIKRAVVYVVSLMLKKNAKGEEKVVLSL